jgi:hypothetical protein
MPPAPPTDLAAAADYLIAVSVSAANRQFAQPGVELSDVAVIDNYCLLPTGRFTKSAPFLVRLRCTRDEYGAAQCALTRDDVAEYLAEVRQMHRRALAN